MNFNRALELSQLFLLDTASLHRQFNVNLCVDICIMTTFCAKNGRVEVDDDATGDADGLHVDLYGDECGEWLCCTGADTWISPPMVNGAVKRNVTRRRPMFRTDRFACAVTSPGKIVAAAAPYMRCMSPRSKGVFATCSPPT